MFSKNEENLTLKFTKVIGLNSGFALLEPWKQVVPEKFTLGEESMFRKNSLFNAFVW